MLSGKLELEVVPYSPGDIVRDTVSLFAPRAAAKGVDIHARVAADVPPRVKGDPVRLRQIAGNLVGNAVKFTEQGLIEVQLSAAGAARLKLEVKDSSIGIAPEAVQRIFEPFSQADDSTTRRYGGTGLGLAISSQIVRLMGGDLTVQSTPGKGSTFCAVFAAPVADTKAASGYLAGPAGGAQSAAFNLRVLLAEDNRVNQLLAQTMLTKLGCTTRVASNGVEAVKLFAEGGFDMVLMDCHMPEMDGYAATAAIRALEADRAHGPASRVPIVAVTANVMQGERDRCIAAGMDDYVAKPFRMADLAAMLEKWSRAKSA